VGCLCRLELVCGVGVAEGVGVRGVQVKSIVWRVVCWPLGPACLSAGSWTGWTGLPKKGKGDVASEILVLVIVLAVCVASALRSACRFGCERSMTTGLQTRDVVAEQGAGRDTILLDACRIVGYNSTS